MTSRRKLLTSATAMACAAAWLAPERAFAQGVTNIVELTGDVLVNGRRLNPDGLLQTGDRIQSGPGSTLGFTLDRDAILIRPNSDIIVTRGASLFVAGGLRLVTGAVLSVFGRTDRPRQVITPTLTAGIRGTGFYAEVRPDATYFCTCFGTIDLAANSGDRETVTSERHQARRVLANPGGGRAIVPAQFENHDDTELQRLAVLVGQRAPGYNR
jgi:hypothetical protein